MQKSPPRGYKGKLVVAELRLLKVFPLEKDNNTHTHT